MLCVSFVIFRIFFLSSEDAKHLSSIQSMLVDRFSEETITILYLYIWFIKRLVLAYFVHVLRFKFVFPFLCWLQQSPLTTPTIPQIHLVCKEKRRSKAIYVFYQKLQLSFKLHSLKMSSFEFYVVVRMNFMHFASKEKFKNLWQFVNLFVFTKVSVAIGLK